MPSAGEGEAEGEGEGEALRRQAADADGGAANNNPDIGEAAAAGNGVTWFGLGFLVFNSLVALYHSRDEPWNAAFVVASTADLLSLFYCLRLFERTPETSARRRGNLKMWVWLLSTLLVAMFTYRVAAIMPLPVAIIVWCMAGITTCGGFYALFVYGEDDVKASKV